MFAKKGSILFAVGLHAVVLTVAAMWHFPRPSLVVLPETESGGSSLGEETLASPPIQVRLTTPKKKAAPVALRRDVIRTNNVTAQVFLPPPIPAKLEPDPVVEPPQVAKTPSSPNPMLAQTGKALSQTGKKGTKAGKGSGTGSGSSTGSGAGNSPVKYLTRAPLNYPSTAQRLKQEGVVRVSVYVESNGKAVTIKIQHSSGFPLLDEAAIRCARQSSYQPASSNGKSVAAWVDASFRFQAKS